MRKVRNKESFYQVNSPEKYSRISRQCLVPLWFNIINLKENLPGYMLSSAMPCCLDSEQKVQPGLSFCKASRIVGEKDKKVKDVCRVVIIRMTMNSQSSKEGNISKKEIIKNLSVIG